MRMSARSFSIAMLRKLRKLSIACLPRLGVCFGESPH